MPYKLYEEMMQAYKSGNQALFEITARNWVDVTKNNPFPSGEAHELFFWAQRYCRTWRKGGIDSRSAKRNMFEKVRQIAKMNLKNPHDPNEVGKTPEEETNKKKYADRVIKKKPVESEEQLAKDVQYVLKETAKAYKEGNETSFEQFTIHMMDIAKVNPFNKNTKEYAKFEEMDQAYYSKLPNMKKLFAASGQLCNLINGVETDGKKIIEQEPKKVLGVIPEEEKDGKTWFKFLHPWKKEGESDDRG